MRPLSVGQEAMWFIHRMAPLSAAYNVALAVRIHSPIDDARLARATGAVRDRHDVLRSRFEEVDGRPWREVRPPGSATAFEVRDDEDAAAAIARPFHLSDGAEPFRVVYLRPAGTLVVAAHHIAADASSLFLILRDLLDAYAADAPLALARGRFDDFVAAERRLLDSPKGAELARYWSDLRQSARPARLLHDRPPPATPRYAGDTYLLRFPDGFGAQVRAEAASAGLTPFAWLLGAFQAALHRCGAGDDFLIGSAVALRFLPGLREVVGHLANTLPLRAAFEPRTTVAGAAAAAGEQLRAALSRAAYPYPLMAPPGTALFHLTLTMLSAHALVPPLPPGGGEVEYAGLRLSLADLPQQEGQFDLSVELRSERTSLSGVFRYDSDLFDRATIERFASVFSRCAQADPRARVADVPLVDPAELNTLLKFGGL